MYAVVVGAGIFGSLITRALRKSGCRVLTIDDKREFAGSRPAACLMKPGWFSSLGKDIYNPALAKLDELVGVQELTFRVNSTATASVSWCDPKLVLLDQNEIRTARATSIVKVKGGVWEVHFDRLPPVHAKLVVVAAGIWTPMLTPIEVDVIGQGGVAWLWPSGKIEEPFIKVWAPYKQIVAFNRGDGLWVGDGLSIRDWTTHYRDQSYRRCSSAVGFGTPDSVGANPIELFGWRPYVKEAKPCFLKEMQKGLWVATGGAKNGTLAAGWCADQITRAVA